MRTVFNFTAFCFGYIPLFVYGVQSRAVYKLCKVFNETEDAYVMTIYITAAITCIEFFLIGAILL